MSYTNAQLKEAGQNLSPEAKDFATSSEVIEMISTHLKNAGLSKGQAEDADSEILYALLGLQTLDDSMKNTASVVKKPVEELNPLKAKLRTDIFDKLTEIERAHPKKDAGEKKPVVQATSLIPEIPPKILPAIEPGEMAHEVERLPTTDNPQPTTEVKAPTTYNLQPTVNSEPTSTPKHAYPGGVDPYREPIE